MTKALQVVGHYYRHKDKPYTIVAGAEDPEQIIENGDKWEDVRDGLCRWFINNEGFTFESLVVRRPDSNKDTNDLSAEIEFVDDGIVMAKLRGYID